MKRDLVVINELTSLHRPTVNGGNAEVHAVCEMIFDNWREFTPKQIGIASTLWGYRAPAEMMSSKQKWNMETALEMAKSKGLIGAVQ
jgi:hypothetical protein